MLNIVIFGGAFTVLIVLLLLRLIQEKKEEIKLFKEQARIKGFNVGDKCFVFTGESIEVGFIEEISIKEKATFFKINNKNIYSKQIHKTLNEAVEQLNRTT